VAPAEGRGANIPLLPFALSRLILNRCEITNRKVPKYLSAQ